MQYVAYQKKNAASKTNVSTQASKKAEETNAKSKRQALPNTNNQEDILDEH